METKLDFSGQVVLVTGASRGIGEQIAKDFASAGAKLVITATRKLDPASLQNIGPDVEQEIVDFTDAKSTEKFLAALSEREKIDVCVNNAGIARHKSIDEASVEDWDLTNSVNLKAPFLVTQTVGRIMRRHQYGRIVNISSIWGHVTRKDRSAYTAAKFGLRGTTLASAVEYAPYNILVNAVAPGFTLTDMVRENYSEAQIKEIEAKIPLGRLATPEEVSRVVLFLASKWNSFVTGQNLVVDGGYSIV